MADTEIGGGARRWTISQSGTADRIEGSPLNAGERVTVTEDDTDQLREVARLLDELFNLAAVSYEGDPWYAQNEGIDGEAGIAAGRQARDLLAALLKERERE